MSSSDDEFRPSCPPPFRHDTVQLAHGGGGRATRELVERIFLAAFGGPEPSRRHDSAVLEGARGRLAFTTDAYVVRPLFFPGGDIGKLAVTGTVNDLAMAGAVPRFLSASFVLEEGLALSELERIAASMAQAAAGAGVSIVTGDTKVVDRGHGDGVYIATSGIGQVPDGVCISPQRIEAGDAIVVSGDVGRHGIAVLSVREGLSFETTLESDCAELARAVGGLLGAGIEIHCLRDLTRGGLAAAVCELALDAGLDIEIEEARIPVSDAVRGASEILGLDPLYIACEGRFVAFVPERDVAGVVELLRARGEAPACVGRVRARSGAGSGRATLRNAFGESRLLELFYGEQLPRIC
jgi:hydrogenase expression/formation protein HypE